MSPAPITPDAIQLEAAHWSLRLAEPHMSDEELRAFETWVEADPAHTRAMEAAFTIGRLLDHAAEDPAIIALRGDALQAMRDGWAKSGRRWRGDIRWAAAAALLLAVFAATPWMQPVPVEHYATGRGERRVVMLSDGSRLSLDAATEIDAVFDDNRRVLTLRQGRAKVDVAKNPLRPFSVSMADRTVVAIGTSFSIELLQKTARVALYEGKVDIIATPERFPAVEYHLASAGYTLEPGFELVMPISGATGQLFRIEADALSWEGGRLTFVNEPLASAVERMNRYSAKTIGLGRGDFATYRVNGVFDAGDSAAFIEGVTAVLPLSAQEQNGRMVLLPRSSHSRR